MLQLKSQIKELFDKAGLSEFTIGRNNMNNLAIVGPCGKAIVEVTNFSVGTKLSKTERDISIAEYIIPTLDAHAAIILDMIKFKQAMTDAEDAVLEFAKVTREKEEVTVKHDFSGYQTKEKYYAGVSTRETDDIKISIYISTEGEPTVRIAGSDTKEIKALTKRADEMLKLAKEMYRLKGIHSDAIIAFDKAEESMKKDCAL